jgi:membrane protease YdiL (CAAX protease family)
MDGLDEAPPGTPETPAGPATPLPATPLTPATPSGTVAPAWHTFILLAYVAGISWMSASTASNVTPGQTPVDAGVDAGVAASFLPRPIIYGTVLASEWILFAIAYWGVRLRRVPLRSLLGYRWTGWSGFGRCLLLAAGCWVGTFAGVAQGLDALGFRHAEEVRRVADLVLPRGPLELALWVVVSSTAGFVEEFVFRGYLQRQFGAWGRSAYVGIALSALVFGAGHLYQGIASAAMIAVVGLCFSLMAHATKSLVPGMIAHGWEDLFSGLVGRA